MASSCKEWPKEATTHHSSVSRASSVVSSNPGTPISLVCQVKSRASYYFDGAVPPQGCMCREATRHITADPEYIPAWKREQKLSSACMYQECSLALPTLSPAPKKGKGRQRESLYQECSASSQNEKLITTSTEHWYQGGQCTYAQLTIIHKLKSAQDQQPTTPVLLYCS